jgi:hypothetical protein
MGIVVFAVRPAASYCETDFITGKRIGKKYMTLRL